MPRPTSCQDLTWLRRGAELRASIIKLNQRIAAFGPGLFFSGSVGSLAGFREQKPRGGSGCQTDSLGVGEIEWCDLGPDWHRVGPAGGHFNGPVVPSKAACEAPERMAKTLTLCHRLWV